MRIRWIVVVLVWIATYYSIFACPYDLHGSSMCSPFAHAASYFGFVFAFPGLLLAAAGSSVFDPHGNPSTIMIVLGVGAWLLVVSRIILYAARRIAQPSNR
jgi:hypothetical protein